ncbi:MAG: RHS repeat-associated core domain-containing protein [Anaerolineae bacterium]
MTIVQWVGTALSVTPTEARNEPTRCAAELRGWALWHGAQCTTGHPNGKGRRPGGRAGFSPWTRQKLARWREGTLNHLFRGNITAGYTPEPPPEMLTEDDPYPGPEPTPAPVQRYYPYGATRGALQMETPYRFTGQRQVDVLGLYFYRSRWYDPSLGRFIQPDPLIPDYTNVEALNRYSYCYNNPAKYTDPTGHMGDPSRDHGIGGPHAFGNLSSHPGYRNYWFATDNRFLWATEYDYREHLWMGACGMLDNASLMEAYYQVRDILDAQGLRQYIGEATKNSLDVTYWLGIQVAWLLDAIRYIGTPMPPWQVGPDGTAYRVTTIMPHPAAAAYTLGEVFMVTPSKANDPKELEYTTIHEYVHVLQYRSGVSVVDFVLSSSSDAGDNWALDTPYEGPAMVIDGIYRQHQDLPRPWLFLPYP